MSSYVVALISIHDQAGYDQYAERFMDVFERFNGEIVAVEEEPQVLEGSWSAGRTVLLRFPTTDDALRWYRSPEYQELAKIRHAAADADIALVRGVD